MAKITKQQGNLGGPMRRPGEYYIASTQRGLIAKKWPRKRGKQSTPGAAYKEAEFGMAARWASSPDPGQLDSAIVFAEGVNNVPRDFLTANSYGTHSDYFFEDGTQWVSYRSVTINAQLVLDQVTDTEGAMMWRTPTGWVEIPPGSPGQFLYNDLGTVRWVTAVPPAAGAPILVPPGLQLQGVSTNVAVNSFTGSFTMLQAGTVITGLAILANAAAATSKVQPVLYRNLVGVAQNIVAQGNQVTGVVSGMNYLPFTSPYTVPTSGAYLPGIATTVALWAQVNANTVIPGWTQTAVSPLPDPFSFASAAYDNTRAHVYCY